MSSLRPVELCVEPALSEQGGVSAAFRDTASIHHVDTVSELDRGQPMADDDGAAAAEQCPELARNLGLGERVERA